MGTRVPAPRRSIAREQTPEAAEFDRILSRIRANVPPEMTPEEIDAEVDAARREIREAHRARCR